MTLHDLKANLEEYSPELYEFGAESSIRCLKLMAGNVNVASGDLILGRVEDFMRFGIPKRSRNIVCIGDTAQILPLLEAQETNCLGLQSYPDVFHLYNIISEQLCISSQLRQGTSILFNSVGINRKADVDKIVDAMGELFGNPVALFSAGGDVIAYRDLDEIYPELLNDFQFDQLSVSFRMFLERCDAADEQPQIYSGFLNHSNQAMLGRVSFQGKTMAYCVVFEYNSFNGAESQLMLLVCAWLAQEIRVGSIELSLDNTFSYKFLAGLIDGHITSSDVMAQSLHTMRLDEKPYYYIIVIDLSTLDVRHGTPRSVGGVLQHTIRNGITTVYKHHLVVMINTEQRQGKDAVADFSLAQFLRSINVPAGVSYSFRSPTAVPDAYRQACRAMELGRIFDSAGLLFFYSDCVVYDLITGCKQLGIDPLSFCIPQLLELLEHDRKFNTQYVYTLYTLIISGGKQTMAAKALGIHRTTMQYRVEKITEKTGLDIYDTYNIIRLYLSFGLLIQAGVLDPEVYYQL